MVQAIELSPDDPVYYSNRAAAYTKKEKFTEAIADAEKAIELKPEWAKGYSRKGAAQRLQGLFGLVMLLMHHDVCSTGSILEHVAMLHDQCSPCVTRPSAGRKP